MNGDQLDRTEGWTASYASAAAAGLAGGIVTAGLLLIAMLFATEPGALSFAFLANVPFLFVMFLLAGLAFGGPVAVLFIVMMAVAERMSQRAHSLSAWLGGGLIAATPLLLLFSYVVRGPDNEGTPLSVDLTNVALVYAAALTAAALAWWMRYRSWRL